MEEHLAPEDLVDDVPQQELRRGTRLGRYELLLPIAKGGMARVWAARLHGQRGFSKTVAIKTILPHLAEEPEFEKMFLNEARIASGVHHPNVCETYELGEEGKTLYLAMEWVNGESFVHILRSQPGATASAATLTEPGVRVERAHPHLCARIVSDAALGLHAAHNLTDDNGQPMGVVHRDVSPHNILITADGNVKVADFGVAKALGQMTNTRAGHVKGKMAYMAPEQVEGGEVDRRSDVFSLGAVLYEASTGRKPFVGDGDAQVMHAILMGQVTRPSAIVRGYPPLLEQIVMRALSQEPAMRYATAERMHLALEEFIAKSGSIVMASHVASFVQERVGPELERRREKIRAAATAPSADDISASGSHVAPPGATPSAGIGMAESGIHRNGSALALAGARTTPGADTARAVTGASQSLAVRYILGASTGIVAACAIAAGVLYVCRAGRVEQSAATSVRAVTAAAHNEVLSAAPSAVTLPAATAPMELDENPNPLSLDAGHAASSAPSAAIDPAGVQPDVPPEKLPANPYGP